MTQASPKSLSGLLPQFGDMLKAKAAFLHPSLVRQRETFGTEWEHKLEELLRLFIATDRQKLEAAVEGYVNFAVNGMRLQTRFEKTRQYEVKSYDQASAEVYHNRNYMFSCYLPGILLSHYLWPHHYRQLLFFEKAFLPRVRAAESHEFCDIGVGTGFYSRQMLTALSDAKGWGFDISELSLEYSRMQLAAYGAASRWSGEIRNVITHTPERTWPLLVNVEVLEHLPDPVSFLKALRRMLAPGGLGFITAAMTAAETDHIYLYTNAAEIQAQLEEAGFTVLEWQQDAAYAPRGDRPVPTNAAFIVTV